VAFNGALVLLTLVKGKVWTGLLAIFVPFLGLVGALRLARPASPWARWRYRPDSRKLNRARRRDDRQRQRWVRWRNRVQDAIAGRPS
jgi:lysyl-tRNA synthetase class 2